MIVIPLAGDSSRFFLAGYKVVKYKLDYGGRSIIYNVLKYVDTSIKVIVVLRKKFDDYLFIKAELDSLGFLDYRIIEIEKSSGQLDSVMIALEKLNYDIQPDEPLIIYNGDTIRRLDFNPCDYDGCIECFIESGDHWSFVDKIGFVSKVSEKVRISAYCSTGYYSFKSVKMFRTYAKKVARLRGELYVMPIYQIMIDDGLIINSFLSDNDRFVLCGTPAEYELALQALR